MKVVKSIVLLVSIAAITFGCESKKKALNNENTMEETVKMEEAGYKLGVIQLSDNEGECPVTIKLADPNYGYMLDPVDIDEDYKKDGLEIWLKFSPLRMQNRCENAHPVELTEIKKK